jgi:iron complex outermembrane receptor protein
VEAAAEQAAEPEPSDQLAEIVITATKRESTVQTTPISITAVSGADIQARGLADFTALGRHLQANQRGRALNLIRRYGVPVACRLFLQRFRVRL